MEGWKMEESDFRSKEELYFSWWLDELKDAGYISGWFYEPETIEVLEPASYGYMVKMKTKNKWVDGTLLQGLSYTPDFRIRWSDGSEDILGFLSMWVGNATYFKKIRDNHSLSMGSGRISYIDTKGSFDRNKSNTIFSVVQKVLYYTKHLYVNKVVPQKLFKNTFTPKRYLKTDKSGRARKIGWEVKTLEDYLNG